MIEEAVNSPSQPDSVSTNSPQTTTVKPVAITSPALSVFIPTNSNSPNSPALSPNKELPKPNQKKFDIDSLNEVKRDVALQSKKLEITNHIFDLLISEIKEELFPIRRNLDCDPRESLDSLASSPSAAMKKKKKKRANRRLTNKSKSLPKIKTVEGGKPVDVCLSRI